MSRHFHPQDNRMNYGEALAPPTGYELDFAIGMTYSLDLEAFLSVPVFLSCSEQSDETIQNPYLILESIKKSSDKIALFCNGDGIKYANPKNAEFFAMIENCIHPISMPEKHYFHPKLWVIRYTKENAPDKLKVIVLSRNLTFDQSMDIAVSMDAEVTDKLNSANQGLSDIIEFVAKKVTKKKKRDKILSLANSVMYADNFDCGNDFESYRFVPFGIDGHKNESEIFFEWAYDLIVVSPFLSESIISKIAQNSEHKTLITRISAVSESTFNTFEKNIWIPKEEILNNELLDESTIKEEGFTDFRDLHAKIIYRTTTNGNFIYLGSLNATANAFFRNVEFMIELKYKPYHGGHKMVLDDLLPKDDCIFRKLDSVIDNTTVITDEELPDFSDVVRAVESATVIRKDNTYQLVIKSKPLKTPAEIAPFMKQMELKKLETETVFDELALKELSSLFVVKRAGQARIIKVPTKGIPEERDDELFNQILNDDVGFFAYLLFLLSGSEAEAVFAQKDFQKLIENGSNKKILQSLAPSLYEQLLRAAAKSGNTIQNIADVIDRVKPELIDDTLRELILLVKKSTKGRRHRS